MQIAINSKNVMADAGYDSETHLSTYYRITYIKLHNYEQNKKKSAKKWIGRRQNMRRTTVYGG